jgi:hypothetical protein
MVKKKTAKQARPKAPRSLTTPAARVFAECAFATAQGMQKAMSADGREYLVNPAARDFWLLVHSISIPRALRKPKSDWDRDRDNVLAMARELGRQAAALAIAGATGAPFIEVTQPHVEAASASIRADHRCKAAARIKGGGGPFCSVA